MRWFGFPVEVIEAEVEGSTVQVGMVYEWASGARREVWDVPKASYDLDTLKRRPLPRVT